MPHRYVSWLPVWLFSAVGILAQPTVTAPALSSAVARGQGLAGSGIARGSIFSIYGSGLGPANWIEANQFPLPTTLGKTSDQIWPFSGRVEIRRCRAVM